MISGWANKCFALLRQVWYQVTDPGNVEGLVGPDGRSLQWTWYRYSRQHVPPSIASTFSLWGEPCAGTICSEAFQKESHILQLRPIGDAWSTFGLLLVPRFGSDFLSVLTKPFVSPEAMNWYQTCLGIIKHTLVNRLVTAVYRVGRKEEMLINIWPIQWLAVYSRWRSWRVVFLWQV